MPLVFVYFQRAELVLYKGIASARHRADTAADTMAKGMGNMALKSLKKWKNFSNPLFSTQPIPIQNTKIV